MAIWICGHLFIANLSLKLLALTFRKNSLQEGQRCTSNCSVTLKSTDAFLCVIVENWVNTNVVTKTTVKLQQIGKMGAIAKKSLLR